MGVLRLFFLPLVLLSVAGPTAALGVCIGDCNEDGTVTIDELVKGVELALAGAEDGSCVPIDADGDGRVEIDELVLGVRSAQSGCPPEATATPTSPPTPTPTSTPRFGFSVGGVIRVDGGTAADSDVNDASSTVVRNDAFDTAQQIPNPVTLGGYATLPGFGPAGPLRADGDEFDTYAVRLLSGQQITLLIAADGVENNLNLLLFDSERALVGISEGIEKTESVLVAESGDYFVTVEAVAGASSYTLTIADGGAKASGDVGTLHVVLRDAANGEPIEVIADGPDAGAYSFLFPAVPPGRYTLRAGTDYDNDGLICGPSNACGAYPTQEEPAEIEVDQDQLNLDFSVAFVLPPA
jgi:hypothetical protein